MTRHLTGPEVARILGVSPNTIRQWRRRGGGPPFHQPAGLGTQATYDPDEVGQYVKTKIGGKGGPRT